MYSTRLSLSHNKKNINCTDVKQVHKQLKTYLTGWRALLHLKEAVIISSNVSKLLLKALHDPHHISNTPAVPDHYLKPQEPPLRGLLPMAPSLGHPTSTTLQVSYSNWSCDLTSTHPTTVNLPDNIHSHHNHRSYYPQSPFLATCYYPHPEIKTSKKRSKTLNLPEMCPCCMSWESEGQKLSE
jgi:hypothetical protein